MERKYFIWLSYGTGIASSILIKIFIVVSNSLLYIPIGYYTYVAIWLAIVVWLNKVVNGVSS